MWVIHPNAYWLSLCLSLLIHTEQTVVRKEHNKRRKNIWLWIALRLLWWEVEVKHQNPFGIPLICILFYFIKKLIWSVHFSLNLTQFQEQSVHQIWPEMEYLWHCSNLPEALVAACLKEGPFSCLIFIFTFKVLIW